jgi:hypothetical protein
MGDLRRVRIDEVRVAPELRDAGFERVARARGLVEEYQEDRLVRQVQRGDAALELALQRSQSRPFRAVVGSGLLSVMVFLLPAARRIH